MNACKETPDTAVNSKKLLESFNPAPAPVQKVQLSPPRCSNSTHPYTTRSIIVDVLRLDLIDPQLGGNKWFKLQAHLHTAFSSGKSRIVSFGGAYSNHLHALAAASARFGFESIGIVRGERVDESRLSPTLSEAANWGMQLKFISRADYAKRYDSEWRHALALAENAYVIPEGGADTVALTGLKALAEQISSGYQTVALACGTGTTLAGLAKHLPSKQKVIGISALKDGGSTADRVAQLLGSGLNSATCTAHWHINQHYAQGGFAKLSAPLVAFMDEFERVNGFQLDPVYNAKLFYAVACLIDDGELQGNSERNPKAILVINTGGLQGKRGLQATIDKLRRSSH